MIQEVNTSEAWRDLLDTLIRFPNRSMEDLGVPFLLLLMLISLGSAFFTSYLYVTFYRSRATGSEIHRAFPLLGLSITAIFISVQFSLPLSLGLLGALSIVRFRTPIKEPEEVGFLMLLIACALCCATFNILFLVIILGSAVVGLVLRSRLESSDGRAGEGLLTVEVDLGTYREHSKQLMDLLVAEIPRGQLDGVVEGADAATLSYRFRNLAPERVGELQRGIAAILPEARSSVFYRSAAGA